MNIENEKEATAIMLYAIIGIHNQLTDPEIEKVSNMLVYSKMFCECNLKSFFPKFLYLRTQYNDVDIIDQCTEFIKEAVSKGAAFFT